MEFTQAHTNPAGAGEGTMTHKDNADRVVQNLKQKIKTTENLEGCGWSIRAEARIAAEELRLEEQRHAEAIRQIEERFHIEAWRHVEQNWNPEELKFA